MAKKFNVNSFESGDYGSRSWNEDGIATPKQRSTRHVQHIKAIVKGEITSKFISPMGVKEFTVPCNSVSSFFREVDWSPLHARILEFHQFEMQTVSILIVVPTEDLQRIDSEFLREQLPNALAELKEKRMTVNIPSKLFKELKKVDRPNFVETDETPQNRCATAEFLITEPFFLVLYDQANDRPIGVCRVYDPTNVNTRMKNLIKHYRKMDEKLLRPQQPKNWPSVRSTLSQCPCFRALLQAVSKSRTVPTEESSDFYSPILRD